MESALPRTAGQVRKRALIVLSGTVLLAPVAFWVARFLYQRFTGWGVVMIPAMLLVPALSALTELVTGIPITELSSRWEGLAGWQRGVLGITIVLVACLVIFGSIAIAAGLGMFG